MSRRLPVAAVIHLVHTTLGLACIIITQARHADQVDSSIDTPEEGNGKSTRFSGSTRTEPGPVRSD
jgi:hypothetical protein